MDYHKDRLPKGKPVIEVIQGEPTFAPQTIEIRMKKFRFRFKTVKFETKSPTTTKKMKKGKHKRLCHCRECDPGLPNFGGILPEHYRMHVEQLRKDAQEALLTN